MRTVGLVLAVFVIFALSFIGLSLVLVVLGMPLDTGIFATVATVELAFVAVFQGRIHAWLRKPELDIDMILEPPFCHLVEQHKTRMIVGQSTAALQGTNVRPRIRLPALKEIIYPVYYYRVKIWNKGDTSAEKTEVMLTKVYVKKDHRFELDRSFPQDNLNWSMIFRDDRPETYYDYISPGTYKILTLGHIWNPRFRSDDPYGAPPFSVKEGEPVFCFDVSFKSHLKYYFRRKGTYGIEIQVAASNAKTKTKRFELTVSGTWSEDEATMLKEGLKIEEWQGDFEDR